MHVTLTAPSISDEVWRLRFWPKVALPDANGCCLWTGAKDPLGYGRFWIGGRRANGGRGILAHRASYLLFVGPIPDGMDLDHICHTPSCVAPDHLRAITHKQNQENRLGAVSSSTTGLLGVHEYDRYHTGVIRYRARVMHNGREHRFGVFDTPAEAEAAVIAGRLSLFTHNDNDR